MSTLTTSNIASSEVAFGSSRALQAINHLLYEVDMLRWTAEQLVGNEFTDTMTRNAIIESFAIHARALADFLYFDSTNGNDVLAQQYCADGVSWREVAGELPEMLEPIKRRVNREIAHLTYTRLNVVDEASGWRIEAILDSLNGALSTFSRVALLSEEVRARIDPSR